MWNRLRRFSKLDRTARGLFLRAFFLLAVISASLRLRGYRKTQASLAKLLPLADEPTNASAYINLTLRMVRAAAEACVTPPTCLAESLSLWWLLGRQGIACAVRIGVRKDGDAFKAHAWVERAGAALNEAEPHHLHYSAFDADFTPNPSEQP